MLRREFFRLASSAAAATSLPRWSWSTTLRQRDLFPLGVASGSPAPDGFVLWTRLLDGPVPGTVAADMPRMPLPPALNQGSIYENQASSGKRFFDVADDAAVQAVST